MKNLSVRIYSPTDMNARWYVYIYNNETQKIIKKIAKGINNHVDYSSRMAASEALKSILELKLKPWLYEIYILRIGRMGIY